MKIKRTGICNTALHQSLAINNFTNQVKATCPCRHMGATALTATKLTQKSDFCLILARISRKSKSSKTGSSDQDFFWLQLLLRANIFFPNNSVSVYCLDNRLGRATGQICARLIQLTSALFQATGGLPKIQATLRCLQLRIHPTRSCPKISICFSTIKHIQEVLDSEREPFLKLIMQTSPTGQLAGPQSILLFPPALITINLH